MSNSNEPAVSSLIRDGVAIIPNFLDTETFRAVRREYEESRTTLPYVRDWDYASLVPPEAYDDPERLKRLPIAIEHAIAFDAKHFQQTATHVVNNERLRSIVSAATRRKDIKAPDTRIVSWLRAAPGEEVPTSGTRVRPRGEYMLHADTHYPTFKAFFYLNPVSAGNGAFVYVRRSHRLSLERLTYEYEAGVRVAQAKKDGRWSKYPYGHLRRPDADYINRLGLREESITGPENTLVIADTSGFHRRGEFTNNEPRETIFMHWRNVDASLLGL